MRKPGVLDSPRVDFAGCDFAGLAGETLAPDQAHADERGAKHRHRGRLGSARLWGGSPQRGRW